MPALQIRHRDTTDGESWTVRASWDDGAFEEISGFQTETQANDWIVNEFPIWLEEIGKARAG